MTFKKWYALNQDKLQEQYEEYIEAINNTIIIPMSFNEFVEDNWDGFDGYCEREELC